MRDDESPSTRAEPAAPTKAPVRGMMGRTIVRDRRLRPVSRVCSAWASRLERAERRRQAQRNRAMGLEPPAAPAGEAGGGVERHEVEVMHPLTTRSSLLDSLPSWLVRGGISAWLLLGLIALVGLVFYATAQVVQVCVGSGVALVFSSVRQPLGGRVGRGGGR